VNCIIGSCLSFAEKTRLARWAVPLLTFVLLTPSCSYSAEPVFTVQDASIPDRLSPAALPSSFYTFEPEDYWAEPVDSWWMNFSNWVIRQERNYGVKVQSLGAWADRTLSGSSHALPDNQSYLRVGFATESDYGNLAQFKPEVRFKLDIPTTEEKLRLVVESESDELVPLSERERDRQLTEPDRTETETTGALRYLSQVGNAINLSTDIGGRLRLPPEVFVRTTARKNWLLDDHWGLNAQQRLYYYHTSGWGARTRLGADRDIGNGWHFFTSSELQWVHSDRKFEAAQIFSTRKRLNNRSVLIPRFGALGESQPSWRTTSYFVDMTWSYRVYEDWLFAELIPALEFPREESFKDQASVIFRIEMYFSGTINRD